MKRIFGILAGITLTGLVVVSVIALAQQPQPAPDRNVVVETQVFQGPEGSIPPPGDNFVFMASEVNFDGKPVKAAPYSAQAVTETTQTLGDGNRIVNKVATSLYRDGEGRTRREQTLKLLGGVGEGGEPLQTIFINDPVAGVSYALDSRSHVAHKSMPFHLERMTMRANSPDGPPPPGPGGEKFVRVEAGSSERTYIRTQTGPLPGPPPPGAPGPEGEQFSLRTEGGVGTNFMFVRKDKDPNHNVVKESLGKQVFDGVEAEGTRSTFTIPAGEIGNERPIEVTNERWYSPELQMVVMSRHTDPRFGETIYRLTDISRNEPAKSLFEVPAGYTVKEGRPGPPAAGGVQMRMRKPGSPE
jgi:hypothetical protein